MLVIAVLLVIFLGYFFYKGHDNTKQIVLNKVKIKNTIAGESSFRVLQLSDLHLENISISADELYQVLKDEQIDLIAITGDFLDRSWSIPKLIPYLEMLNKIETTHGMFAVLGNHDYILRNKNLTKLVNMLSRYHCKIMRNEHIELFQHGQRINIIGIDDHSTKRSNLPKSYNGLKSGYNLVITHDPNIVLTMKQYPFDYLLSGHFHGGQICYPKPYHLIKMGKLVRMEMIKGLQTIEGKPFYINEGLGQTGLNIRVGSRPEITIHQCYLPKMLRDEIIPC